MTTDVATGIARILKQEGVEWVSTFPVCRVNNALGRENVPMLMMRDDRYAIAVADAFSRITGGRRIGVATVQGGVNAAGLQVAYAGLAQAYEFMRRAFTLLRTGRPGPVILAVPEASGQYDESADPYAPVKGWKAAPDPADVKTAVRLLLEAQNPLVYAGEGVIYADAAAELKTFVEAANVPVILTLKAKGAFPENHPLFVGVRGGQVNEYLSKSDLILAVGTSLSPGRFSHAIPHAAQKTIISCNVSELDVNKVFPTAHALIGDARFALQALAGELSRQTDGKGRQPGSVAAEIKASRDTALATYREAMASDDAPINPYRVYSELMKVLDPQESFVTHESGNIPRGFLGWGNVSSLGYSLAAVVAAKKAHPERSAVAVTGEAGLGYMMGNLEVPVREKLGVTVLHISNGGFAGYGPGFWGEGHDPYTHKVLGPEEVDLSKAMREFGFHAERVTEADALSGALQRALTANSDGVPAYIEAVCSQFPVYGQWVTRSG